MSQPSDEPRLEQWLKPVRRRLAAVRLVRRTAAGLLAGSCAALLPLAAARFLPLAGASYIAAVLVLAGLAAGMLAAFRPRIDDRAAARVMDSAGTDDAIVTALDSLHLDTPVARLQRADAEAAAARYAARLGERLPWPRGRERGRYLAGLAAVWAAAAVLLLLPNPMEERLAAREALSGEIERVEQALDGLEQSGGLSEQDRDAILEPLHRLREQALRMEPEALKAEWEATEREIARFASELKQERQAIRSWAQELQRTPELGELGQALERGDRNGLAEAAERLGSELKRLDPAQREAVAERLRELAANAPDLGDDGLREAFERAADALDGEDPDAAAETIGEALAEALPAAELEELAELAASALASAGSRLGLEPGAGSDGGWNGIAEAGAGETGGAAPPSAGGPAGSGGTRSDGGTGRETSGNGGSSPGETGGKGKGEGGAESSGGQGAGSGAGSSGSGSGSGTGTGGSGAVPGNGTGPGAGRGSGGRALVTTPRLYEGEGEATTDGGPVSGSAVTEGGKSPVIDGGVHHYEEVYASYEADARRTLSGGTLPPALKERVKNYFDEIQPDR